MGASNWTQQCSAPLIQGCVRSVIMGGCGTAQQRGGGPRRLCLRACRECRAAARTGSATRGQQMPRAALQWKRNSRPGSIAPGTGRMTLPPGADPHRTYRSPAAAH
ncbi:hypothetical protein NDU88_003150 [Pleurodeles waltl]|uniref:Uncharacterized protein n=1 Tax=Pleurodeles waltl TaxID=8319 RepID=A0AAV7SF25_PLEWA|nr:hypothetical protein NDU88_003150 [Pleurodeles waltl]